MKTTLLATLILTLSGSVALAGGAPKRLSPAQRDYVDTVKLVKSGYDGVLHPDAVDMGNEIERANAESLSRRGKPLPKQTERAMSRRESS